MGKPVYVKLVDFGALPNNTSKAVADLYSAFEVVQVSGYLVASSGKASPLECGNFRNQVDVSANTSGTITITTTTDASNYSAYFFVKYTKS